MKRVRILLLGCAVLSAAAGLCACEQLPAPKEETAQLHIHSFGAWEEVAATCTQDGVRRRSCTTCDFEESKSIGALGHDMKETAHREPTCTEAGFRTLSCTRCEFEESEPIGKLGHDMEETAHREPTCTEAGFCTLSCTRCEFEQTTELPPLPHSWSEVELLEEPTCTKAGLRAAVCTVCGKRENEQIVPATGHSFGGWQTLSEPTCTVTGEKQHICEVCGADEKEEIPAVGHRFDPQFTVDEPPTAEHGGWMSRHCLNQGCEERAERTPIEPLKTETEYRVLLRNSAGEAIPRCTPHIEICGGDGAAVYEFFSAEASFTLPTGNYFVKVSDLPKGYSLPQERYELLPERPVLEIRAPAHLIMEEPPATLRYNIGSVLYDMDVQLIALDARDDRTISLHEIFSQHKAVLVNMYFTTCGTCVSEMPAFVAAYNTLTAEGTRYGEEVACVMLDAEPYTAAEDTVERLRKFKRQTNTYLPQYAAARDIPMYVIHDAWLRAYFVREISNGYYPTSILIDSEGVIMDTLTGGMNTSRFLSWMQRGIDRYNAAAAWRQAAAHDGESEGTPIAAALPCDLAPSFTTAKRRRS